MHPIATAYASFLFFGNTFIIGLKKSAIFYPPLGSSFAAAFDNFFKAFGSMPITVFIILLRASAESFLTDIVFAISANAIGPIFATVRASIRKNIEILNPAFIADIGPNLLNVSNKFPFKSFVNFPINSVKGYNV